MIFFTLINSLSVSEGLGISGIPPNFKAALNSRLVDWVVYRSKICHCQFVDEVIKIQGDPTRL